MARVIRALVALDGVSADAVASALPREEWIDVVGVVDGIDAAARTLGDTTCDVLVIACTGYSDRALLLIEGANRNYPERPIVVLSEGTQNGFVTRVFEAGADDIVRLPQTSEAVGFAIQKAFARRESMHRGDEAEQARMIVVLGPKGGTGKTLTATNLAIALQQEGRRVALVDLDLQFGDVALSMGLPPDHTIHELVTSGAAGDMERIESFLVEHPSGVKVLVAPSRPDQAAVVTVELMRDIYNSLRPLFDVIVVDTPPGFTPEVISSIDVSTDLVLVGMLDALSLKNTKLGLETLELMGNDPDTIRLVLNRAQTRVGIPAGAVEAILGRAPEVLVPSDREISRAVNEGTPVMLALPESEAAIAFRQLAGFFLPPSVGEMNGHVELPGQAGSRRLFRRKERK